MGADGVVDVEAGGATVPGPFPIAAGLPIVVLLDCVLVIPEPTPAAVPPLGLCAIAAAEVIRIKAPSIFEWFTASLSTISIWCCANLAEGLPRNRCAQPQRDANLAD
jgi:hypothetical protein